MFNQEYDKSKTLKELTPSEIMGTMLHEIGHNFFLVSEQCSDKKYYYYKLLIKDALKLLAKQEVYIW